MDNNKVKKPRFQKTKITLYSLAACLAPLQVMGYVAFAPLPTPLEYAEQNDLVYDDETRAFLSTFDNTKVVPLGTPVAERFFKLMPIKTFEQKEGLGSLLARPNFGLRLMGLVQNALLIEPNKPNQMKLALKNAGGYEICESPELDKIWYAHGFYHELGHHFIPVGYDPMMSDYAETIADKNAIRFIQKPFGEAGKEFALMLRSLMLPSIVHNTAALISGKYELNATNAAQNHVSTFALTDTFNCYFDKKDDPSVADKGLALKGCVESNMTEVKKDEFATQRVELFHKAFRYFYDKNPDGSCKHIGYTAPQV